MTNSIQQLYSKIFTQFADEAEAPNKKAIAKAADTRIVEEGLQIGSGSRKAVINKLHEALHNLSGKPWDFTIDISLNRLETALTDDDLKIIEDDSFVDAVLDKYFSPLNAAKLGALFSPSEYATDFRSGTQEIDDCLATLDAEDEEFDKFEEKDQWTKSPYIPKKYIRKDFLELYSILQLSPKNLSDDDLRKYQNLFARFLPEGIEGLAEDDIKNNRLSRENFRNIIKNLSRMQRIAVPDFSLEKYLEYVDGISLLNDDIEETIFRALLRLKHEPNCPIAKKILTSPEAVAKIKQFGYEKF